MRVSQKNWELIIKQIFQRILVHYEGELQDVALTDSLEEDLLTD